MQIVARSFVLAVYLALLLVGSVNARPAQYPRVTIILPEGIPSEKVVVQYVLYGSFGASGNFVPSRPNSRSLEIRTSIASKAANRIKMFVWAPGCKIATFEMALHNSSDIDEPFLCAFLPKVRLEGKIGSELRTKQNAEVSVIYSAEWACTFFGFFDCMIPQIQLGTAKLDVNGTFAIEIPDFASDPIASPSIDGAELHLLLREAKTWNHIANLEAEVAEFRTTG